MLFRSESRLIDSLRPLHCFSAFYVSAWEPACDWVSDVERGRCRCSHRLPPLSSGDSQPSPPLSRFSCVHRRELSECSAATRPRQSRRRPVVTRVQLVSWLTSGHLHGNAAEEEVPSHLDLHYSIHTPSGGGTKQADEGLKRAVSQSLER